ncbi:ABC transporter ATP-binding protein [Tahibacter soli]|uniref:ABC transporter ATP-binding protein n=1 Tax=Tahibacter soli TaxID=2983605 RepID=A0A9X3YR08_9GAMM|nr:ABC transporter ATP-binding protein [Tahibacter soli]MDC8015483.1 ABC transporter ATP-binding protein [Tahibacter soli]
MHCLEVNDLVHRYRNGDVVLDGVTLRIPAGSIYGFLGPNGAGKTTTLRLILGLIALQHGAISIFGLQLAAHRIDILRRVGSLIESPSLYDHLTATENLALLQAVHRVDEAKIGDVLDLVGLAGTHRKKVGEFSLGMKQRLAIAVALLHEPELLILDEPTNGLDPNGIVEMRALLTRLNRERGLTIVISSHLLAEIERLATHVGIIHRGRVLFEGTLDELQRRRRTHVALATNDDERAIALLARQSIAATIADGRIVMPAMPNTAIAQVNRRLVDAGLDVHELHTAGDDLEAIFMNLVSN